MKYYESKYTGAEVDALLGKVESGDVGGKVTVDSALSTESENPVMNKVITEELNKKATSEALSSLGDSVASLESKKADKDGVYSGMTVGRSIDLLGVEDVEEGSFLFRPTDGDGSIKDGVAVVKSVKGNSVVWNQLLYNGDFSKGAANWYVMNNNSFSVDNGVATIKLESDPQYEYWAYLTYESFPFEPKRVVGHKYLFKAEIWLPKPADVIISSSGVTMTNNKLLSQPSNIWFLAGSIGEATESRKQGFAAYPHQIKAGYVSGDIWRIRNIGTYDLTKMFGAGYEPTTIEEFYARIPMGVDLNAYNEGEVIHMDVQSVESQGVNAWDEEWELGRLNINDGSNINSTTDIRSKNYNKVLPSTEYYIETPNGIWIAFLEYDADKNYLRNRGGLYGKIKTSPDCHYLRFYASTAYGTTYNHDICINISDTSINGKYFPYIKRVEDLSIIRKYFPNGMKSAGSAHDEIRYNKATQKWEKVQRIGEVDMGTYRWYKDSSKDFFKYEAPIQIGTYYLCGKYNNISVAQLGVERGINVIDSGRGTTHLRISDLSYTNEAEFNASIQGVILYYELAEPIVTELDAENQNFRDLDYQVWNCGTEKAIAEGKSAPLAADITYGFNAIGKIKELEKQMATLMTQLASLTSNNA